MSFAAVHLCEGHFFTDAEMSRAGLMVRVKICGDGMSDNAFGLRQCAQAEESDILIQNKISGDCFQVFIESSLFSKRSRNWERARYSGM